MRFRNRRRSARTKPALSLSLFQSLSATMLSWWMQPWKRAMSSEAVSSADKKLIVGVQVFDIFTGASLGEGKKSIAVEVLLQPQDRTLTDEDLEALSKQIVASVAKQTGGVLRG